MKIKKKRKITKEELKGDRFEETVLSLFNSFKKEPRKWSGAIILFIAIFAALLFLTHKKTAKSYQGERIFIQALTFLNGGKFQDAENLFREVYENAKNTFEGKKSMYYLGHLNLLKGNFGEAERYFREYLSSSPQDDFLEAAANEAIATIYFYKKSKDKAIKYINLAIQKAPFKFQKSYYFLRKIEMLRSLGESEDVIIKMIEENKEMWKNSLWEQEIISLRDYFEGALAVEGG